MGEGGQGAGTAPSPRDHLVFFVNGAKQVARNIQPETTLLQYLRDAGLTGTKLGCGEGGCGACTVMVSAYDHDKRKIKHAAVNACLAPVCSVDWCHVTTVEGVGSMRLGIHPVQKRIAEMHGSQCGFCTPGFVMALYALLRSNPSATAEEIEEGLDGNLCRCTGYRPILDAAKSLGVDSGAPAGCCRGGGGGGGGGGGCPCFDGKAAAAAIFDGEMNDIVSESSSISSTAATDGSSVPSSAAIAAAATAVGPGVNGSFGDDDKDRCSKMDCTGSRGRDLRFSERYTDASEPIFPASLMLTRPSPVTIAGDSVTWHFPTTLENLVGLKAKHPQARIVAGNTQVGIETKFEGMHYPVLISPSRVPELHAITANPDGSVFIGGSASLSAVEHALSELDGVGKDVEGAGGGARGVGAARACVDMLRWFASTQIRNVACLAGNLATASPISDMKTLLAACGADVILASTEGGRRTVKVRDCFLGCREDAMEPHEVILGVTLPNAYYVAAAAPTASPSSQFDFVRPFKQARRRQNGASIVTGGLRVRLEPRVGKWVVLEAGMCFGGMAPTTVAAPLTEAYLTGKEWSAEVVEGAYQTLAEDLPLPPNVPGGQSEYRRALPPSFLFKFFVFVSLKLEALSIGSAGELPPPPVIGDTDRSAATSFITDPKRASRGQQEYTPRTGGMQMARPVPHVPIPESGEEEGGELKKKNSVGDVGKAIPHKSSTLQVTGEAVYTDDMPSPVGTLYGGLVLSTKPHAKLLGVDPSEALKLEGVLRYVGSGDISTERNAIGLIVKDEEVFAVSEVHCVGQVIGTVLADTAVLAEKAAKLVTVRYEELPTIMTIGEAIAADSFYVGGNAIVEGDVEGALAGADVVVDGELKVGAQEHFYLETSATLAVPGEDGSLEILAATQNPEDVQRACASVCGVDLNKVVCRCKRLGGAFGGKGSRSIFLSCVAALSAHVTGRPVRLSLDRDVDMQITGHRHAFLARYRAGATKNGKLCGMEVKLYSNAGCSLDLSSVIMNTALLNIDCCYSWPALQVEGFVCKTNQASHTAFRGFGAPQAMLVTETVMDHLATTIGIDVFKLRTDNMYKEGDVTFYGQPLNEWNVRKAWSDMQQWAEIERRRKQVDAFNAESRWRKQGLSVIPTKLGICFGVSFLNQGGALVHIYQDGTVLVTHGGMEMGQGLHTKICQVVASAFGIETEKVHIAETATDKVANSSPTGASVSIDLYGMAALDACEQITERLKPIATQLPPGSPFASLVSAAYFQRVNLSAQGFYKTPGKCEFDFTMDTNNNAERGPPFTYFTQGVTASEVEVDCLTGDAKVVRADILMDIGASINPAIDIGQIEGGFVQGFGWCTMEETTWGDAEHPWAKPGQLFTRGPGTYKIPSSNDVPSDMRVKLMDKKNPFAVHSSKAVGEPPFCMASSAFFAIKDAVASARRDHGEAGYFVLNSPASSERIRTACLDGFMERSAERSGGGGGDGDDEVKVKDFQAKGSW